MKSFIIRPLNTSGYVTAHAMPSMVRNDYSYIYLISGEILTEIGGRPYLLRNQDCALIPPETNYTVKYFKDSIGYMGAFSSDLLRNSGHRVLRLKNPSILSVAQEDRVFFDELMIRMSRFSSDIPMLQNLLELLLCQFDNAIPHDRENASSRISSAYLEKVFDQSQPFGSVASYAAMLGITPSHLNRAVKANTGRSAGEWIENARISLARNLIHDESMSISEIAYRLGFEDASYFSRFFRKAVGMSPSDYRELIRG